MHLFGVAGLQLAPFRCYIGPGGLDPGIKRVFHSRLLFFEQSEPGLDPVEGKIREVPGSRRESFPGAMRRHQVPRHQAGLLNPLLRQLGPNKRFQVPQALFGCCINVRRISMAHHHSRARQGTVKRVIVGGRDGVELVIVTAGTGYRQALKGLSQRVDLVINHVRTNLAETNTIVMAQFSQTQERGSDQRLIDTLLGVDARLFEEIAGQMFANELVVGNVVIERADEVVTVKPGAFDFVIPIVAESLGEPHDVHPVTGPMLPEMG